MAVKTPTPQWPGTSPAAPRPSTGHVTEPGPSPWSVPPSKARSRRRWPWALLGAVAVIVLIAAVAGSASNNTSSHQPARASSPTTAPVASSPAPPKPVAAAPGQPRSASAPAPPAAQAPLFTQSGSGTATTANFTVPTEWNLTWHYDCSNFAAQGNFFASVEQQAGHGFAASVEDQPVDQLGSSGSGVEHYHYGGNIYLSITSECSWSVQATRA